MVRTLLQIHTREDDPLTQRRGQSLAALLLILIGITIPLTFVDLLTTRTFTGAIINTIAVLLFVVIYFINRSGRLQLAVTIVLAGLTLLPLNASLLLGEPLPQIFFGALMIVVAAAFGNPRAPLIWAALATPVPFLINMVLYGSLVPPAGPVMMPNGVSAPPLLAMELIAVAIYWMVAGTSWLAVRLLYETLSESRVATQAIQRVQQELAAQQVDLAVRNEQLTQARQKLEGLVASLAVPIMPVADGIALLPVVGTLDAVRAFDMERRALEFVFTQRMRALVIDLSGASGLDTMEIQLFVRLCSALRLLGVTPIVAGLGAQNALLLSRTDVELPRTAATVQSALSILQQGHM